MIKKLTEERLFGWHASLFPTSGAAGMRRTSRRRLAQ